MTTVESPRFECTDLELCIDCTHVIANGVETEDHERAADGMVRVWGDDARHIVYACPEDCEGWFSSQDCDGCGSTLGGDRHPAVLMLPVCPGCGERTRPIRTGDPAAQWGGTSAHMDGEALCPVVGPTGYVPADHPSVR